MLFSFVGSDLYIVIPDKVTCERSQQKLEIEQKIVTVAEGGEWEIVKTASEYVFHRNRSQNKRLSLE